MLLCIQRETGTLGRGWPEGETMKLSYVALTALLGAMTAGAQSPSKIVDLPLKGVYLPRVGFDDNDSIEIVIDGELPALCHTLNEPKASVDKANKKIKITQTASRRTDGACAESATLPEEALVTNPFQETINVGQLEAGRYEISYVTEAGDRVRKFDVATAPVASVDNARYAMVSNASVPDVTRSTDETTLQISGMLPTPCHQLGGVSVQTVDDVTIVLPVIKVTSTGPCLQVLRPYRTTVDLGKLEAGRRLVHIRSANGRSVNRLLTVEAPTP